MTHYLVSIYFIINAFMAGLAWPSRTYSTEEYLWAWFYSTVLLLFGLPASIIYCIYWAAKHIWIEWLDGTFQLKFFFKFYFTKKWNGLDEQKLQKINKIAELHRKSDSLRDRITRRCIGMINQRNNYTYKP